jgi:LCP family protein required for cell wall assembly
VLVLVVLATALVIYTERQLSAITRFPMNLDRPERPAPAPGRALNILVAGVDDPDGTGVGPSIYDELAAPDWTPGMFRSDAIMVLHLPADGETAQLVSIPRDSYVDVPEHGRTKVNAAFSYGGPPLLARTVEDLTGIRIDHAVVIDFTGLATLTDIVGGVDLHLTKPAYNPVDQSTWSAGTHHFSGAEALAYVRERHTLLRGDFDRIQRQQNFLRALLGQVARAGTLTNPVLLLRLVNQLSSTVAVDDALTNGALRSLALAHRGIRPGDFTFATVPVTGTPTIDGASVVTLDLAATRSMFQAMNADDLAAWLGKHATDVLPDPQHVN